MADWNIFSVSCLGTAPTEIPVSRRPLLLIFPADSQGETLAAAVAKVTGAVLLGRIHALRPEDDNLVVSRNTHGGRLRLDLRLTPCFAIATSNTLLADYPAITLGESYPLALEQNPISDQGVRLEAAHIVIGGGRGLDPEAFEQLSRIACALDAAVSASLPAVDLGLAPVARQVGQSGKFVNPAIYFAAGMSGTPQHFVGVGPRSRVVAVNVDGDAPIFRFAEIGAVEDARQLLPLLADKLEQRKASAA